MDRKIFFDAVRTAPFGGSLSQAQVDGIGRILDEWDRRKLGDTRWLAYMLATVFHETGRSMQPVEEAHGDVTYLQRQRYYPWYGRGLVQITWQSNYAKFGITTAADALTWQVSLRVLFDGMLQGMFTGKKLGDYFTASVDDPLNARRIVNGTDRAEEIAGYHRLFLAAIQAATVVEAPKQVQTIPPVIPGPPPAVPRPSAPPPILPTSAAKPGFWARFWAALVGKPA